MPEKIKWSVQFQVTGGPGAVKSGELEVTAYDKITATVPKGGAKTEVDVQPSPDAIDVKLMVISAEPFGEKLTYQVPKANGDPDGKNRALDGPHVLIGSGAVGLLGTKPPQVLFFYNNLDDDAVVQVLVGRNAS